VRISPVRTLVVEDEKKVASFIKKGLRRRGMLTSLPMAKRAACADARTT
jgi:DNA-binding response OmpR family regulator